MMAQMLFAVQLPVRGAIVSGEADFVPGTDHIVGRGVIDAVELQASQNWFGVMLSSGLGSHAEIAALLDPRVLPMIVRYVIPLKAGISHDGTALNWRLNITAEAGTQRFFHPPADDDQGVKLHNTLAFAKHVRDTQQAYTKHDRPWLRPIYLPIVPVPDSQTTIELVNGDEY